MQMASASSRPATPDDVAACQAILRAGSKSFHAASLLLPPRVRGPAAAVYAFCRVADDAVDGVGRVASGSREAAVERLGERLDRVYAGAPEASPIDRALALVVREHALPRAVFDALLEGFRWDLEGRRYETIEDVTAYCVRVASSVGVLMTLLMGDRRAAVLYRACDLGVAMQLTNIARDVGEDARDGRLYLPLEWMREAGIATGAWLERPTFSPALGRVVERVLSEADALYDRADLGIAMLPRDCRMAIRAARLVYSDIGREIRAAGLDSVSSRAFTSGGRKAWLLARSTAALAWPTRHASWEPPVPAARFLVDAAASERGSA